jgi:hypothetical protein
MLDKQIVEDGVPVTNTDNGGAGLVTPELPIKTCGVVKRFLSMKKKKSEKDQNSV